LKLSFRVETELCRKATGLYGPKVRKRSIDKRSISHQKEDVYQEDRSLVRQEQVNKEEDSLDRPTASEERRKLRR
jgi:hypothetical protein